MLLRNIHLISTGASTDTLVNFLISDLIVLHRINTTRYLNPRNPVLKSGNLHLAFAYAQNAQDHHRFINMVRVSPQVFYVLHNLIADHPVFQNKSNVPQTAVEIQLAVTLYRMGRFGNAASLEDIARACGISEGSVELFTSRCFKAFESIHTLVVRQLTREEKQVEKDWISQHLGFIGLWQEGWAMYDGTIVVLYAKPMLNGHAYYTRKANYGLNAQIGNTPSNLRIVDYSHGMTGSAHDAAAYEWTGSHMHPDLFFEGEEFAWGDSAYTVTERMVAVHKRPASLQPENALFDKVVAHLRVRSEHCIGALKGRFQCLRGLRVNIHTQADHVAACRWITMAIIIHNLVIDVEGYQGGKYFMGEHTAAQEEEDRGQRPILYGVSESTKRERLVQEIVEAKGM